MNTSQLKTHIIRRLDGIVLTSYSTQVKQDILSSRRRGACITTSLNQHLLKLHKHVRVETSKAKHGDDRSDGGRGRTLFLEAFLGDVEGLRGEGGELVVNHPASRWNGFGINSNDIDCVLNVMVLIRKRVIESL